MPRVFTNKQNKLGKLEKWINLRIFDRYEIQLRYDDPSCIISTNLPWYLQFLQYVQNVNLFYLT